MSLNSPAKQERIERHLMRQRGAGVRTVSANFGFSFGLSAPASSDATPIHEEPPAKRRKTIEQNSPIEIEQNKDLDAKLKDKKNGKSRRRLPLDDDAKVGQVQATCEDDSFVFGLESKKTRRKQEATATTNHNADVGVGENEAVPEPATKRKKRKTTTYQIPKVDVEDAIQELTAEGRPRRRAAATAAVKVADGFVEEEAPVDKKRRDVEPDKKTKRMRKKYAVAQEEVRNEEEDELTSRNEVLPKNTVSTRPKNSRKRKVSNAEDDRVVPEKAKRKAAPAMSTISTKQKAGCKRTRNRISGGKSITEMDGTKTSPRQDDIAQAHENDTPVRPPATRPAKRPRKRNVKDTIPNDHAVETLDDEVNETHQTMALHDVQHDDPISCESMLPTKTSRKQSTKDTRAGGVKASQIEDPFNTQRQPLNETDINLIRRSVSPEKLLREARQAKPVKVKSKASAQQSLPTTSGAVRSGVSNRPKLQVQRDGGELTQSSGFSDRLPGMTRHAAVQGGNLVPATVDSAISIDGESLSGPMEDAASATVSKADPARRASRKKPKDRRSIRTIQTKDVCKTRETLRPESGGAVPAPDLQAEEDVDWLFAPQQPGPRLPRSVTLASKRSTLRHNVQEIDLDDLMSNIASIAQGQGKKAPMYFDRGAEKTAKSATKRKGKK